VANFPKPLIHPRHWPTWLGFGLLRLLALLPYPLLMITGRGLGHLVRSLARRRVHIADTNLRLCYPDWSPQQRRCMIRANFASVGMGLMEFAMTWWWSHERVERRLLEVEGEHNLPVLQDSQGTIFLTAHFSSIELSGRYLSVRTPSHAMYRRNENPVIQYMFERQRTREALISIIARDDVRSMIRALRAGEGVWFAPDQNHGRGGNVFADFKGVPAATTTATTRFSKLTGARVIPFVLIRIPGGYRLIIEPALEDFPCGDVQRDTQAINDIYSRWADMAPEQYNWIHRRFKDRPDGSLSPYA
jgi:KDO2-lipid IV(A) lauroyltransferase